MRLWSIHPKYLDSKGLVALWREGLLAQKVLLGHTTGYTNHPQLIRFRRSSNPLEAIATYLRSVRLEAEARNYHFDGSKIIKRYTKSKIEVTDSQISYEVEHLLSKLKVRNLEYCQRLENESSIDVHPIFQVISGPIESWEIINN